MRAGVTPAKDAVTLTLPIVVPHIYESAIPCVFVVVRFGCNVYAVLFSVKFTLAPLSG